MKQPDDWTESEAFEAQALGRISDLEELLALAWNTIQEAGYEDHNFELRDKIKELLK